MFSLKALLPAVAAAVALVTAGTASAATADHVQQATAYQNTTIARMMSAHPGGERVDASTVVWANGDVIMHVPASAGIQDQSDCGSADFCTWTGTNFTGTLVDCSGYGQWCAITARPFASFLNNTPYRVWLQQYQSHTNGGHEICTNQGDFDLDLTGPNTTDPWAWLSTNPALCS